ncbi:MAG: hypothetical protein AUJ20_08870 [Comamonadaceae bacterium CG1_02_60_18]|nr:MAG: hypothetical protein AUJ20_08870 [Comamonadaceae bacterium CG1_02_60_18]PIQ53249.1 MAG: metal-dependent hydrolase [Comamonadaceae bacterium CG12_big_fil_rev_8_21_14_0_65_59_15]
MLPLLRFTLDLFEQNWPLDHTEQAQRAIDTTASKRPNDASGTAAPAADAPSSPQPAQFKEPAPQSALTQPLQPSPTWPPSATPQVPLRHPRASHEVRLGEVVVAYEFKRSQRRSIGFSVGPEGLEVRAPRWAALRDVNTALQSKSAWILRKLHEVRERHAQRAALAIDWRDGAQLPYLGQTITVQLDPAHAVGAKGAQLINIDATHALLRVSLAHNATAKQVRDRVQAWLMQQARQHFLARLDHFAPALGVRYTRLGLSNAATRWGSASADGSIRLNWKLVHFSPAVVDYVVVHELSHLRVMDHSAQFWRTVASVVPDYPVLRQQLKTGVTPEWSERQGASCASR